MRVAVLGAAGLIGRAVVRDLHDSPEVSDVMELDRRRSRAGGADIAAVDGADRQQLTLALEPADLVVNAAGFAVNDAVMDAALAARCHYLDLGGPLAAVARQHERASEWERAGLVALPGCGARPGLASVLATWAAEGFDSVDAVRCASAHHDPEPPPGVSLPDALETLLGLMREAPLVVRAGRGERLRPFADGGVVDFPAPIGARSSIHVAAAEVETVAGALRAGDADARMALTPRELTSLRQIALGASAPPVSPSSARTTSVQLAEVTGTRDGAPAAVRAAAVTGPHEAWGAGGTVVCCAGVAAATVRLLARGALLDALGAGPPAGVLAPQRVLPRHLLFPELERRGTVFSTTPSEVAVT